MQTVDVKIRDIGPAVVLLCEGNNIVTYFF